MIIPVHVHGLLARLRQRFTSESVREALAERHEKKPRIRLVSRATPRSVERLWDRMEADTAATSEDRTALLDDATTADLSTYSANIENMIGTVKMPVGVIGPLVINGIHASGGYLVPLATTEAALVASYGRGADVTAEAGGISAAVLYDGVLRTPAFRFKGLAETGLFVNWVVENAEALKDVAEATTSHGRLISLEPFVDSDLCYLLCRYATGDAAGQNMATIATDAVCRHILDQCPIAPKAWYVEGNFSGDKKGSFLGLLTGRGAKVTASVTIPAGIVRTRLGTDIDAMLDYGAVANLGSLLSGQFGAQAQYANALAALYIATGQDAACVSESAVGVTRMERRDGGVFVSVTLPNILVGTVGGGTCLPSQAAGLRIMGLQGPGHRLALAEVAAGLCLCGEVSIIAAMAAGRFTRAHEKLARRR